MGYEEYRQRDYRLIGAGVLLAAAVLYVAFQGSAQDAVGVDPFTGKKLLIVWESYSGDEHKVFLEVARRFEAENPDIKVSVAQIPWMGQESKYRTSLIAGSPPDIGRVDTTFLPELVANAVVEDLAPHLAALGDVDSILKEYVPAAVDSCLFRGTGGVRLVYGLPDQTNGACLFWNKAHFRDAGLDPDRAPETWEEFLDHAKKLTDPAKNRFGFGMDNSLWWTFPFLNTYGAKFLDETGNKCLLASPEAVAALQFKADLALVHRVEGGAWTAGGVNTEVGFVNGKYSMILMGPWNISRFRNAKLDFGVGLIPRGPAGTSTNVGGTNMIVFKRARNKPEAVRFLRFLTGAKIQAEWANRLGQIPVNLNAYAGVDTAANPTLGVFMEQMKSAVARPKVLKYGQLEEIINPLMETALAGKMPVPEALSRAVERIEREVLPRR